MYHKKVHFLYDFQRNANEKRNQSRGSGALNSISTIITESKRLRLTKEQIITICYYNKANPNFMKIWVNHYGKKDVKWGINYNFSEKTTIIFAVKTALY